MTTTPVYLSDLCDPRLVADSIRQKLITERTDPDTGLRILCYTAKTQYGRTWTEATRQCRGLILDPEDRVIARPFPKFFWVNEPDAPAAHKGAPVEITEKLDGSLGIAYQTPSSDVRIATKSTFDSEQATVATRIWRDKYDHVEIPAGVTALFEIIYPQNRIVIDYGALTDLILLAVIDNRTGADLGFATINWPGAKATVASFGSFTELAKSVAQDDTPNLEGYVARFAVDGAPSTRFKLKFPSYITMHRAATGLTPRRLWEALAVEIGTRHGTPVKTMVHRLKLNPDTITGLQVSNVSPVEALRVVTPEECLDWFDETITSLRAQAASRACQYEQIIADAKKETDNTTSHQARKTFALALTRLAKTHRLNPGTGFALRYDKPGSALAVLAELRPPSRQYPELVNR